MIRRDITESALLCVDVSIVYVNTRFLPWHEVSLFQSYPVHSKPDIEAALLAAENSRDQQRPLCLKLPVENERVSPLILRNIWNPSQSQLYPKIQNLISRHWQSSIRATIGPVAAKRTGYSMESARQALRY